MKDFKPAMTAYFQKEIEVIKKLNLNQLDDALNAIYAAWQREADIYIFGNGGSAATASHTVCDFNKGISEDAKIKFRMHCLSDNVPTMMAIANDHSYEDIFVYQLRGKLRKNDLVIAISGSGNSKNVLKAVEYAKQNGTKVIGITGYDGGKLKQMADYHMDANVDDMQISEDLHMIFDHMMMRVFCGCK